MRGQLACSYPDGMSKIVMQPILTNVMKLVLPINSEHYTNILRMCGGDQTLKCCFDHVFLSKEIVYTIKKLPDR